MFTFNSSITHRASLAILNTNCSAEVFTILIPIKVTFQSLDGRIWILYKKYQSKISFPSSKAPKIAKDPIALPGCYSQHYSVT